MRQLGRQIANWIPVLRADIPVPQQGRDAREGEEDGVPRTPSPPRRRSILYRGDESEFAFRYGSRTPAPNL